MVSFLLTNIAMTLLAVLLSILSVGMIVQQKQRRTHLLGESAAQLNTLTEKLRLSSLELQETALRIGKATAEEKEALKEKGRLRQEEFEKITLDVERLMSQMFNDLHAEPESKQKEAAIKSLEMRKEDILEYVSRAELLMGKLV